MKIVILTSHFPSLDCPEKSYVTPFLFDYAKEWVNDGHDVFVIHYARSYPKLFNLTLKILSLFGDSHLKRFWIDPESTTNKDYIVDNIRVFRRNYKKTVPHGKTFKHTSLKLVSLTKKIVESEIGKVDLVIGDCLDPVLQILNNSFFFQTNKKAMIIHNADIAMLKKKLYLKKDFEGIDCFLIRSKKQKAELDNFLNSYNFELFFSGIPETSIPKKPIYRTSIQNLLYVGALLKTKGLLTILEALKITKNEKMHLTIVGDGVDKAFFEKKVNDLHLQAKVSMIGKVPHEEVFSYMKKADSLVLVSKETFGMVYVEAMSQACVPVAALNEGIDGVVNDRINGFLVPLNDSVALADLFNEMQHLPEAVVSEISRQSFLTAAKLTNSSLAKDIIKKLS